MLCINNRTLLAAIIAFVVLPAAQADDRSDVVRKITDARSKLSEAKRKYDRLSVINKARVLQGTANLGGDPDGDRVGSFAELAFGTNVCDADSDDDGISDRDEASLGTNPRRPDDNPRNETEVTATLTAKTSTTFTIGSTAFTLTPTTRFIDDDNNPISVDDFAVSDCVEGEGITVGGVLRAKKIKDKRGSDDCD